MMLRSGFFSVCVFLLVFTAACDSSSSNEPNVAKVQVRFDVNGLAPLLDGFHYQAWVKVGFEFIPTSSFNVTETGQFTNTSGQLIQKSFVMPVDISEASVVFITIEDKRDSDDEPSGTVLLAGDVSGAMVVLSFSHALALGHDFSGETGLFSLLTPSDSDPTNETQGVWFTTGPSSSLSPGLTLPSLPGGWAYQGWVESGGVVMTTGAFTSNTGHDLARPHALPDVPAFPGEDFLVNPPDGLTFPLDLSGATVFISIEPFPDDTKDFFGIRILEGQIPTPAAAGTPLPLAASGTLPSGTATLF